MNFSEALYCLKQDKKLTRLAWRSKHIWVEQRKDENFNKALILRFEDNNFFKDSSLLYEPEQDDLFANDWCCID